jgi:hypothetical protein
LDNLVYDSRYSTENDSDWDEWDEDEWNEESECEGCGEYCDDCTCEEDAFLDSEVDVKALVGHLFNNSFDELATTIAKKFLDREMVKWSDVHDIEGDVDFLRDIAGDMGLTS